MQPRLHQSLFNLHRSTILANSSLSLFFLLLLSPLLAQTTLLDPLTVDARTDTHSDPTGMGGPEAELDEPPFSNDLLSGTRRDDELTTELTSELQLTAGVSPADLATAVNRINLRGFPSPRLRNGFSQTGVPEVLNTDRVELIQGPITPLTGRAAPGGIQNFVTFRPRGKNYSRLDTSFSSHHDRQLRAETSAPLIPKKLWHRLAAGWQERTGPEHYAFSRTRYASAALTWKHSRAASTLLMLDYSELSANPTPGIPEYRASATSKIIGPYLPLADFHTYGPTGHIAKKTASASAQFEAALGTHLSLRANLQTWQRSLTEDRFTTGQYLLDLARFSGTREPQHIAQPLRGTNTGLETTARFSALKADHKLSLLLEANLTHYTREQRALERSSRDALPADLRSFDPYTPNYFRPEYSPDYYSRILTDRREATSYQSISLSDRAAYARGKLVTSSGLRLDFVSLDLTDAKPGALRPHLNDRVRELTQHLGANYQLIENRLLLFANTSTAFEPSTRVDARTGRIQGNETTLGYETGLKGLFLDRRLSATVLFFRFYNQNISRRNPLYDDPIADAAQTQPQLLASGEERFTGATLDLKASPSPNLTFSTRATLTQALTTASPDLPEEVGRPLSRMPRASLGLTTRYAYTTGPLTGLSFSTTLTFISHFVANYESTSRQYLAYPDNTLLSANLSYQLRRGDKKRPHIDTLGLSLRNALNQEQLARLSRYGQNRDIAFTYSHAY